MIYPASQAISDMFTFFKSDVTDALNLPTKFPNQKFVNPSSGLWCEVGTQFRLRQVVGLSPRRYRQLGDLTVKLFNDPEVGTGDIQAKCDGISQALSNKTIGCVHFQAVDPQEGFLNPENLWQQTVFCPFYFDSV